jgi:lipopolysaccharide transport system ATP-binding protein
VRNRIVVSRFDAEAAWHGHGGARIVDVSFGTPDGEPARAIEGGEEVRLRVLCHAARDIQEPIVGFMLRDRLGQNVFGDSTYLSWRHLQRAVTAGEDFIAEFVFQLPFLANGDYGLTVAITEGTQEDHTHVHWIEEAVVLGVEQSPVSCGIIGVPAIAVEIKNTAAM